jgi:hypothetical protein
LLNAVHLESLTPSVVSAALAVKEREYNPRRLPVDFPVALMDIPLMRVPGGWLLDDALLEGIRIEGNERSQDRQSLGSNSQPAQSTDWPIDRRTPLRELLEEGVIGDPVQLKLELALWALDHMPAEEQKSGARAPARIDTVHQ